MEAKSSHVTVSESELSKSVKSLRATKGREHADSLEYDSQVTDKLAKLYEKHDADLRAIFKVPWPVHPLCLSGIPRSHSRFFSFRDGDAQELDENPRKALKYPPGDAADFCKKYAQGFYTYAEAK